MNRRGSLKILGFLGLTGIASFLTYKYNLSHPNFEPGYLLGEKALLAELVEIIIPETDTPGAKSAMVHLFVIEMVENCTSAKEKGIFYRGMESLKAYCKQEHGRDFMNCKEWERQAIISHFEKHDSLSAGLMGKVEKKLFGEPFFSLLKRYTINGYCVSFLGATRNFRYDPVPVVFKACIPYTAGEPSWATK
ncbi:hypothetical protein DBR11_28545 [Pedobacter sp. HMWF019]|uniref:gluconate 2-dehydrogenase subunit 3 family protein n=1 Tax=Pedobacter sp. HMWF019 TaxID=2056856 RepID=UPI000D386266|nr:gluconate 2-dehydrogenase subunit 3 family protein [Pedobacter sp. HMWF019]PTS91699.1 hypothetical protein DBR11_28545 [Pedobacter sp. HMWF019]